MKWREILSFLVSILITLAFYYIVGNNFAVWDNGPFISQLGSWLFLVIYIGATLFIGFVFGYLAFMMSLIFFAYLDRSKSPSDTLVQEKSFTFLLPVENISAQVFLDMIKSIRMQNYNQDNIQIIVILANNTNLDPVFWEVSEKNDIELVIQPPEHSGYKAGALNSVLSKIQGELVIILDKNHIVHPDMCHSFLNMFQNHNHPKLGYIQAAVDYFHHNNFISRFGSILRIQLYYFFINARSALGNAQFHGSTCCFKREVLENLDEFPIYSYTENTSTSVAIQLLGYRGLFLPRYLSRCPTRETKEETIGQLYRWSHGVASVINREWKSILKSKNLSFVQKYDMYMYLFANTPASSMVLFLPLFLVLRLLYAGIGIVLFNETPFLWIVASGLMILLLIPILSVALQGGIRGILKDITSIFAFSLISITFPIYLRNAFSEGWNDRRGPFSTERSWSLLVDVRKYEYVIGILIVTEITLLILFYSSIPVLLIILTTIVIFSQLLTLIMG